MNVGLLTRSQISSALIRANELNNSLYVHENTGLDAHASEGAVSHTFTDSGGNSLSALSLVLGGYQSGLAQKVYVPLAQNPVKITSTQNVFRFVGLLFTSIDDLSAAISVVMVDIDASDIAADAKTAIKTSLGLLVYEDVNQQFTQIVNGIEYQFTIEVVTDSGTLTVTY